MHSRPNPRDITALRRYVTALELGRSSPERMVLLARQAREAFERLYACSMLRPAAGLTPLDKVIADIARHADAIEALQKAQQLPVDAVTPDRTLPEPDVAPGYVETMCGKPFGLECSLPVGAGERPS